MDEATKGIQGIPSGVPKLALVIAKAIVDLAGIVIFVLGQPLIAGILLVVGGIIGAIVLALYNLTLHKLARLLLILAALLAFGGGIAILTGFFKHAPTIVVVLPSTPVVLRPATSASFSNPCPVQGSGGSITKDGVLELTGLKPSQVYYLTLNGYSGKPPNDELKKCNSAGDEGYCDFMLVKAGSDGNARNVKLEAAFPSGVTLRPDEAYRTKFFVKDLDAGYCIVLFDDNFLFTVREIR